MMGWGTQLPLRGRFSRKRTKTREDRKRGHQNCYGFLHSVQLTLRGFTETIVQIKFKLLVCL